MNGLAVRESGRMVGAIAGKDIQDALRNKTILGIMIGVAIMILSAQALPLLLGLNPTISIVVYDEGESELLRQLRRDADFRVYAARSRTQLEELVQSGAGNPMGLVLPVDLDAGTETAVLEASLLHWVDAEEQAEIETAVTQTLTQQLGRPVQLAVTSVYPLPDVSGSVFMIAMSVVLTLTIVCAVMVPMMFVEEKQTHTLDALLVSPASTWQIVAGKAIAGLVYGVAATAVILVINRAMVVHWGWLLTGVLAGALFAVALGLLLGVLFDNEAALQMWTALIIMVLIVPILLLQFLQGVLPAFWQTAVRWLPTLSLAHLIRLTFAAEVPVAAAVGDLTAVLLAAGLLFALVAWRLNRLNK